MPPITIPRYQPIGDIRAFAREPELAPRQTAVTGVTTSPQAEETESQAIQTGASTAQQGAQFSQEHAAQAQDLMKPYEKLRQAREVMQATDIATNTILEGRSQLQAMKSSGVPYTEWIQGATKALDDLHQHALETAGRVSPAAQEVVMRELASERLNQLAGLQKEVVGEDIDAQRAVLLRQHKLAQTDYFATSDPLQRAHIEGGYFANIKLLNTTGILSDVDAEKLRQSWYDDMGQNTTVERAKKYGLADALDYADTHQLMTPLAKLQAANLAKNAVSADLESERAAQAAVEGALHRAQQQAGNRIRDRIYASDQTIGGLQGMEDSISDLEATRQITHEDSLSLRASIHDQRTRLAAEPVVKSSDSAKAQMGYLIATAPEALDVKDIYKRTDLSGDDKDRFIAALQAKQLAGHFSKTNEYVRLVNLIGDADPGKSSAMQQLLQGVQRDQNPILPTSGAPKGTSLGEQAIGELYWFLANSSQDRHEVLSNSEVHQLAEGYALKLAQQLHDKTYVAPSGTRSFDMIQPSVDLSRYPR